MTFIFLPFFTQIQRTLLLTVKVQTYYHTAKEMGFFYNHLILHLVSIP